MRHVPFTPPESLTEEQRVWWDHWETRSRQAQERLDEAFGTDEFQFDSRIWCDLKEWMASEVFKGKCAYCEDNYSASSFGDAEHYRPKGKVTIKSGGKNVEVVLPTDEPHPGYYWLAYHWSNLVPACSKCNNKKRNHFPTARSHIFDTKATSETLDEAEEPLIINPCAEDPKLHLAFDDLGMVHPRDGSMKGDHTIKALDLNREELIEGRKKLIDSFVPTLGVLLLDWVTKQIDLNQAVDALVTEETEYSEAIRDYVNLRLASLREDLDAAQV